MGSQRSPLDNPEHRGKGACCPLELLWNEFQEFSEKFRKLTGDTGKDYFVCSRQLLTDFEFDFKMDLYWYKIR